MCKSAVNVIGRGIMFGRDLLTTTKCKSQTMPGFHHFFYIKTKMTTSGSPGTTKLGSEHIAAFSSLFRFQI